MSSLRSCRLSSDRLNSDLFTVRKERKHRRRKKHQHQLLHHRNLIATLDITTDKTGDSAPLMFSNHHTQS
ncbi:unnamed protein product [Pleuronectes platessa]|uniref:Uncharacterized protein n=1 Tax=Pleuronectes platessa TaxID=8262 RepID=A0A9N7TTL7_PLEPL|nr:unnamed protein product [Pleuronectes platessa]